MKPHPFKPFTSYRPNGRRMTADWCTYIDITLLELSRLPEDKHGEHFCHESAEHPIHLKVES